MQTHSGRLPLCGSCCVLVASNVEVVKNLPLEFSNALPEKSTHQNGAYAAIRGEGMV